MKLFNSIKKQIDDGVRMFKVRLEHKNGKLPYSSKHIANTIDGNYPIFLADDFVFVKTRRHDIPQAIATVVGDNQKEIYVNNLFLTLDPLFQDAIIQHEVGHLELMAIYTSKDRFLTNLGLSNKAYLAECAADDYSKAGGHRILQALMHLHATYPIARTKELRKRILRLMP